MTQEHYGYTDGDRFQQNMKGGGANVICMEHALGIAGCPHCAKAKDLYARADAAGESKDKEGPLRKEAKTHYLKKLYFAFGEVNMLGKPQHGQVCLVNWPILQVEEILKKVMHKNADVRWPNPDDPLHGRPLIIDKQQKEGGGEYATYSTMLSRNEAPLNLEWWEKTRLALPALNSVIEMQKAIDSWGEANKFSPYSDMQKGESASIRLFPHNRNSGSTPFALMKMHFVAARTAWDKAWMSVGYDPSKLSEVLADPQVMLQLLQAGVNVGASAGAQPTGVAVGYAGTPVVGGVALPGMPKLDDIPY